MAGNVGYGKPPQSKQFKKGASGNPKGRPKGSRNLKTDLVEELHGLVTIVEKGKQKKLTKQQALIKRQMNQALNGDHKSVKLLLDLMQHFERTGDLVPQNTPTSEEDRRLIERFAAKLKAKG